jgi:hypothetical protein
MDRSGDEPCSAVETQLGNHTKTSAGTHGGHPATPA